MAQQKITVEIQPTPALRQMIQTLIQGAVDRHIQPDVADLEPVTLETSDGERIMYVDEVGETHWPLRSNVDVAEAKGWRRAFVKKVGR